MENHWAEVNILMPSTRPSDRRLYRVDGHFPWIVSSTSALGLLLVLYPNHIIGVDVDILVCAMTKYLNRRRLLDLLVCAKSKDHSRFNSNSMCYF